jgi:hypothetical protein
MQKSDKRGIFLLILSSSRQPLVGKVDFLWALAARLDDSEAFFWAPQWGRGGSQGRCPCLLLLWEPQCLRHQRPVAVVG